MKKNCFLAPCSALRKLRLCVNLAFCRASYVITRDMKWCRFNRESIRTFPKEIKLSVLSQKVCHGVLWSAKKKNITRHKYKSTWENLTLLRSSGRYSKSSKRDRSAFMVFPESNAIILTLCQTTWRILPSIKLRSFKISSIMQYENRRINNWLTYWTIKFSITCVEIL